MRIIPAILAFAVACAAACFPVTGDRILGSHLAEANPALTRLSPSLVLGFTPAPGTTRTFSPAELLRITHTTAIATCFELAMRAVTADDFTAAMKISLSPSAILDIVETQTATAPAGEVHFPLTSLEPGRDIRLWRGYVQYTPTRRAPLWAKVRIQGQAVSLAAERPVTVHRGETVQVDVHCGPARLRLEAVAQKDARSGETLELLNPASGLRFRARLEGAMAIVNVGGLL